MAFTMQVAAYLELAKMEGIVRTDTTIQDGLLLASYHMRDALIPFYAFMYLSIYNLFILCIF